MDRFNLKISGSGGLQLAGGLSATVGLLAVSGWVTGTRALVQWLPSGSPMVMNSALCAIVGGAGMIALAREWRRAAAACGVVITLLAATVLTQFIVGRPLGVNELFWRHQWTASPLMAAGRMAPNAAVAFLLLGLALTVQALRRRGHWLLPVMGGVIGAFALLPLVGYLIIWLGADSTPVYEGMALPTLVSLLTLAVGLLRIARSAMAGESAAQSFMAAALGMIISIFIVTVQNSSALGQANDEVVHSYQVRGAIDHMVSEVARMEDSARGYGLTGVESFRLRVDDHQAAVRETIAEVQRLVAEDPAQLARVVRLRGLAEQKFALYADVIRARQTGGVEAASRTMTSLPTAVTSALVNLADEMGQAENRLLVTREQARALMQHNTRIVQAMGTFIALGLIGASLLSARRSAAARRVAEAELRTSRARLVKIFDAVGDGVVYQSPKHGIEECNAAAERILGLSREQLTGKKSVDPDWRAVREDGTTWPGEEHPAMETLRTGVPQRGQLMGVHRGDGSRVWVSINTEPVLEPGGAVAGVVVSFADVTAWRQAQVALRESEGRFRTLVDATAEAVVISADGRVLDVNDRALEMFAFTREDAIGCDVLAQVVPSELPRVKELLQSGVDHYEARFRRKDGREFDSEVRVRIVQQDGRQVRLAAMRDITERNEIQRSLQAARDQALEASRLKSEFLATMSHEVRTPMNGIIGMAELLLDTPLSDEQREMGSVLRNSAENLLKIINDILDFSRIEAGKLRLDAGDFELQALIEETLALLAPRAHDKPIELLCDFGPGLEASLQGDPGRIRQVVVNLVGNAIKFTEHGEVIVKVRRARENRSGRLAFRVAVQDTGVGIPEIAASRLFQPFTQVDGTASRRFGGTGLGLAISRQLVELMGGKLGFESEDGVGSTFWFELELATGSTKPKTPLAPFPGAARVLIVDDHAASGEMLLRLAAKFGLVAETVSSATAALARLAEAPPYQLVFLDWHMPEMSGLQLGATIRAHPAWARLPLVLLASAGPLDDPATALAVGFAAMLTKPVREEQMHRCLSRVLGEPEPEPAAAAAGATLAPPVRTGWRLLLAEDNPANQTVARLLILRMGHAIDVVANGREALALLAQHPYDAVLMDCQMPVLDGYETTRRIRDGSIAGINPRVPIIALTAYAMASDQRKCLEAGMDDYVSKPLRSDELRAALLRCGLPTSAVSPAAPTPPAVAASMFDPEIIAQLRTLPGERGPSLLPEVIETFLRSGPADLNAIARLAAARDGAGLVASVHRFAGSCANLGAQESRAAAMTLERAAEAGEWDAVRARLAELQAVFGRLRAALEALIK